MHGFRLRAALPALLLLSSAPACAALDVAIAFVGDRTGSAWSGAQQGLDEARLQGEFLGQQYTLTSAPGAAAAIVAALPTPELLQLAAQHPELPVLSVGNTDPTARKTCRGNLLFIQPDDDMLAAGVRQWRTKNPNDLVEAQAWHPAFEKYAAAQLNKRYAEKAGKPMDDEAWAGWAAVKVVSDTIARSQSAAGAELLAALRGDLAFDGQKGSELSFRADGQLRQPLLLVRAGKLVGEAPVRGVADTLDSLGAPDCNSAR